MRLVLSPLTARLHARCLPSWLLALGALLMALPLAMPVAATAARAAECPYTPPPGTSERKAITDALRKPVMADLKQRLVFVVAQFGVCGDWAFIEAEPQQPGRRPVDWTRGRYAQAVADDMCGGYVHALLVRTGSQWRVKAYEICATDVPWVGWAEHYGAPKALFPKFD